MLRLLPLILILCGCAPSQESRLQVATFEKVWSTVKEKHFDPAQLEDPKRGLSWQALHDEFLPRIEKAESMDETRQLLREMIAKLGLSHFQIIGADIYKDLDNGPGGDGRIGIEVAVIDGKAYVRSVEPGSPAAAKGIQPGWRILSAGGRQVDPILAKIAQTKDHPLRIPSTQRGFLLSRLSAMVGEEVALELEDGAGQTKSLAVKCEPAKGAATKFGFMPAIPVWMEFQKKQITPNQTVGVFKFNLFLDPPRLSAEAQKAIDSCAKCQGFIIDIRGNPGGIGALAMGLGGFFVSEPGLQLGQMIRPDMKLNFILNPRLPGFKGPLAILVDGSSGSTSEIFAGGMQDVKRARIFGSRTMGAALPSVVEKLPNGDGFQYAVANYISHGGKTLEGYGVIPDEEVALTRESLLANRDAVLDAAIKWINGQKTTAR
jgi:carboxyl-terminal processing protease